jgi:hypothetical protein
LPVLRWRHEARKRKRHALLVARSARQRAVCDDAHHPGPGASVSQTRQLVDNVGQLALAAKQLGSNSRADLEAC